MKSIHNICYSKMHGQKLDIHLPEADSFPVFLYFHGGGLEYGDKEDEVLYIDYLTERGIAVVSANYRMYPKDGYPAFFEDAAEAVAWTLAHIGSYGNVDGVYVGGSSAGGYICQMLCFDKRWLAKYGISPMEIRGFVLDAGQPTCHFRVLEERGVDSRRVIVDESAPLYHVGEDESYPPMLILVSDDDMENRLEQTQLLVSTLAHFGHREQVKLKILHGSHCAYVNAADEAGESIFGKLIYAFISGK